MCLNCHRFKLARAFSLGKAILIRVFVLLLVNMVQSVRISLEMV